jgi:hypothetical protein
MKKYILAVITGFMLMSATLPQFFYYSDIRRAIAVRGSEQGTVIVKNNNGQTVMTMQYPANSSRWVSVGRLAPGQYTAVTTDGGTISFYKRP